MGTMHSEIVEPVKVNFVDFGYCTNISGNGIGDFNIILPLQSIEMCKLEPLAPVPDKNLVASFNPALVHSEHTHAAYVGIDIDLENMAYERC